MLKIFGRIFALIALVTTLGVACGDDTSTTPDAADAPKDLAADKADTGTGTDGSGN